METNIAATDDVLLPARKTMQRYGIADRTLDRWVADPKLGFPRPVVINTKRYLRVADLRAWELKLARAAGSVA
jgi:predicted DNA-binding transcriptional regulator AlpA